jgi:hypothetical protein
VCGVVSLVYYRATHSGYLTRETMINVFQEKIISLADPVLSTDEITRRERFQFTAAAVAAVVLAAVIVVTHGRIWFAGVFLYFAAVAILTFYRLEWGLYLFIGTVLVCDQFKIPGFEPYTLRVGYFRNLKEIPYFPSMDWAVMNLLELHFLLMVFIWLLAVALRKDVKFAHVPAWGAALILFFWIAGAFTYGMRRGGDFLPALWEIRALVYLGAVYFFVPQVLRTKEHVRGLMWVCITAISFKAFQGIARLVRLGFSFQGLPTLTNHEDPLFIISLIVFLSALVVFRANSGQRRAMLLLLIPLLLGFITGQRRASYAALFVGILTFIVLIQKAERRIFAKVSLPVVLVLGLYAAVFWESNSKIASPLQLIKSGLSLDPDVAGDRYSSNLYREFENYNLAMTLQREPIYGIGFGNRYDSPIDLASISFPLRDYIPHNEIFWLIVKMGSLGFFAFCFFFESFILYSTSTFKGLKDPYLKAVCAVAIIAVIAQIVVSYFDLQLTYYRNMVYLGCLMGLVSVLKNADKKESQDMIQTL